MTPRPPALPAGPRSVARRAAGLLAGLLVALAGCSEQAEPQADAPRPPEQLPDIVVYLVDTLRADALGIYGSPRGDSPAIDAFASRAAVFESAVSQAPWTLPSVTSLFTSTYPASHRILGYTDRVGTPIETMADYMKARGYRTVAFVSNTNGGKGAGLDQGFDEYTEHQFVRDAAQHQPVAGNPLQPLFDWAAQARDDRPLFLYVHTVEPHQPYEGGAAPIEGRFDGSREEKGRLHMLMHDQRRLEAARNAGTLKPHEARSLAEITAELDGRVQDARDLYDGDVRQADDNFEHLTGLLARSPRWQDTILVLLSDHGEEFKEHGSWFHGQSTFQELLHVPLVVRAPGLTDAGRRVAAPVQLIDVLPTLAELVGGPRLPDWQGRSLVPLLRGEPGDGAAALSMRIIIEDSQKVKGALGETETALVEDGWKLIVYHDASRMALFDLRADPREQHDLSEAQPERARALLQKVQQRLRELPKLGYRATDELDAEAQAQKLLHLEELGYVEKVRDG